MTDLDKLREALEMVDKATEPDREIDYAITAMFEPERHGKVREWSASLNAIVALTEREMPGFYLKMEIRSGGVIRPDEPPTVGITLWQPGQCKPVARAHRLDSHAALTALAAFLRARIAEAEAEQQEDVAALTSPRQMADN